MPDPCVQEPRLNHLENELAQTVRKIRDDQKRQTALLENIARQSARMDSIEAGQARHEKAITELFNRSREYDKMPGAMAIRVLLVLASVGSASVSGLLVWAVTKG